MSHQHRRFIRHHVRELIATRRCVRVHLPSGRIIRGHRATKVETPPGTLFRWFTEGAKPGAMPYYVAEVYLDGGELRERPRDTGGPLV